MYIHTHTQIYTRPHASHLHTHVCTHPHPPTPTHHFSLNRSVIAIGDVFFYFLLPVGVVTQKIKPINKRQFATEGVGMGSVEDLALASKVCFALPPPSLLSLESIEIIQDLSRPNIT